MFLQKIDKLASDWGYSRNEIEQVAKESLLYGMRIVRHPSALKRELRRVKIDSLIAKPLWSGNAYLLMELPEVMTNKKKKIPCLEDFHFARTILTKKHLTDLKKQVRHRCNIPREELIKELIPQIQRLSWKGRFLPKHDGMYENLKDVQGELVLRCMEVINKEMSNFKSNDKEEILTYLSYCISRKSDTFLKKSTPKAFRVKTEDNELDEMFQQSKVEEDSPDNFNTVDFKHDLKKVLAPKVYRGVALLMEFADAADQRGFNTYLIGKNVQASQLNQTQLKSHIERYLGVSVFNKAYENKEFKEFLKNRIRDSDQGGDNVIDGGYAGSRTF